ncbi:MAG: 8-oxo-dGTP diphosphatase [Oscillospiraceae bacterium]|nr:8-oxo-dGTP diphosphatase [Oscillospiraceae bacterium]
MLNTTLCYLENGRGEWLMLHRVKKKNDVNHDKWIGVGGKFEAFESPEDCLLREVREETGLTLTVWRFRGVVTFCYESEPAEQMFLFTATGWTGNMRADCDEGTLEWVPKNDVAKLPVWEGDRLFFRLLAEEHAPFLLKLEYHGDTLVRAVLDGREITKDEWRNSHEV